MSIQLLDHLETTHPANFDTATGSSDLNQFLMGPYYLRYRGHSFYLFKFCSLCATSSSPQDPVISFGSTTTAGLRGRLSNVVLPSQSTLSGVPEAVSVWNRVDTLAKFALLAANFGRSAFMPEFNPWTYVDSFGCSKIYQLMSSSFKNVVAGSKVFPVRSGSKSIDTSLDRAALTVPFKL